mmetsp:Transcript_24522/g.53357  ORF Transcript_24522/g.53357 Transcript_24522/m.53357 type:complete len:639 (-) Transcript_24522:209-2125(-)
MDVDKIATELYDEAEKSGHTTLFWKHKIFRKLRECPQAVGKPRNRDFTLLHQAARWGVVEAVETLLGEFKADPMITSSEPSRQTAAELARAHRYEEIAVIICAEVARRNPPDEQVQPQQDLPSNNDPNVTTASSPYKQEASSKLEAELGPNSIKAWLFLESDDEGNCSWKHFNVDKWVDWQRLGFPGSFEATPLHEEKDLPPKSVMAVSPILWEWDGGEGGLSPPDWRPYSKENQCRLEHALCRAIASVQIKVENGQMYNVNLVAFRQFAAKEEFRTRRIRRSGVEIKDRYPMEVKLSYTGSERLNLGEVPDYWKTDPQFFSGTKKFYTLDWNNADDAMLINKIGWWMNKTMDGRAPSTMKARDKKDSPTLGAFIEKVEMVMHPELWRRYCYYRAKLKLEQAAAIKNHQGSQTLMSDPPHIVAASDPYKKWLDEEILETYMWHGTGAEAIDAIVGKGTWAPPEEDMEGLHGVTSRCCSEKSMFGQGVYLADLSSKANLYVSCPSCGKCAGTINGVRHKQDCHCFAEDVKKKGCYRMLLCRAALGRVHVEAEYKVSETGEQWDEKYKQSNSPKKKLVSWIVGADSVKGSPVDGKLKFPEYVVYDDCAVYPEFIVHYKRSADVVNKYSQYWDPLLESTFS